VIVYRGTSLLDHITPIVVVATGLHDRVASGNGKTGAMIQLWIMVDRAHPRDAIYSGADVAICGDCPHRFNPKTGRRSCYVSLATGLQVVGKRVRDGAYGEISIDAAAELARGRLVRLGAYGDPAAVPFEVWERLLTHAAGWTGYTHQWRRADRRLRSLVMASVDDPTERLWAEVEGWRTFRVRRVAGDGTTDSLRPDEIMCPASEEAGKRTQCERCKLCDGTSPGDKRRSIAIIDHSTSALSRRRRLPTIKSEVINDQAH
jgi:hypothetical protein